MKYLKKYIPCNKYYLLKLYLFMILIISYLTYVRSCPVTPFNHLIIRAITIPTIAFIIISPLFGLIFTQKSFLSAKFYLPYKYINNIRVNKLKNTITISYNYYPMLGIKSRKEYKTEINIDNYQTTIDELLHSFPQDISINYNKD